MAWALAFSAAGPGGRGRQVRGDGRRPARLAAPVGPTKAPECTRPRDRPAQTSGDSGGTPEEATGGGGARLRLGGPTGPSVGLGLSRTWLRCRANPGPRRGSLATGRPIHSGWKSYPVQAWGKALFRAQLEKRNSSAWFRQPFPHAGRAP